MLATRISVPCTPAACAITEVSCKMRKNKTTGKTFEEIRTLAETGMVKPQWMKMRAEARFYTAGVAGHCHRQGLGIFPLLPSQREAFSTTQAMGGSGPCSGMNGNGTSFTRAP